MKSKVWDIQTIPKIKIFMWRALSGDLAVAESLASHGIHMDLRCRIFAASNESIAHVLFLCFPAFMVWSLVNIPRPQQGFSYSICENMEFVLSDEIFEGVC